MRLISIHLRNIKSHRERELSFSPGINVLSGANGSGKSTVFEAIGYALFGVDAQDFVTKAERFLSIGAKKGEVSVVFEAVDGSEYRVTRSVGGGAKWLLASRQGDDFEVEEHANIQETETRIAGLLGLSGARSLADQFKLVIGPFQNEFLGPFVIRQPTKRQTAFDEILGIDAWRKTIEGTKSLNSTIIAKMDNLQVEVAGKKDQVAALPGKEEELASVRQGIETRRIVLARESAEMARVNAALSAWDAHKEKMEAALAAQQTLQERVRSGKDHVANQQLLVEQSGQAALALEAARPGKLAYDAAEERLKLLREDEQRKSALEKEMAAVEKDHSAVGAALAGEIRELEELTARFASDTEKLSEQEKAQAQAQADLKQEEAAARASLEQANRLAAGFKQLRAHRIEGVLPHLQVKLDQLTAADAHLAQRELTVAGAGVLKAQADLLPARQAELVTLQQERSQLAGKREALNEGCEKIGGGECPFLLEPCKNLEGGGAVELFGARIAELDAGIASHDAAVESLSAELERLRQAALELAAVEQVARDLEKARAERRSLEEQLAALLSELPAGRLASELDEFLGEAGLAWIPLAAISLSLTGSPQQQRLQIEAWADGWQGVLRQVEETVSLRVRQAEEPVQACALRLGELRVRDEELQRKKRELAADRERLELRGKQVAQYRERLALLERSAEEKKQALSAYSGLGERIHEAGEELKRYQKDRDAYIVNLQAAQELEKRRDTLSKFQTRLQQLETELTLKDQELRQLQEGYRPELHEEARRERDRLTASLATLQTEITEFAKGAARLEGEIATLKEIAAEIQRKLAEIEDLRDKGNLVKFLRGQVFKNVSSQLSERFREEISFRADRIYRSIAESDEELFWGENYQIVLKDMVEGGLRERSDDQLSGGQMMSAVVALRLALLQTIGARIAFFDEPTSNLDADRRENLARAFRAIDTGHEEVTEHWYDQLFLVSHDVSFTEITDQTIQLDG